MFNSYITFSKGSSFLRNPAMTTCFIVFFLNRLPIPSSPPHSPCNQWPSPHMSMPCVVDSNISFVSNHHRFACVELVGRPIRMMIQNSVKQTQRGSHVLHCLSFQVLIRQLTTFAPSGVQRLNEMLHKPEATAPSAWRLAQKLAEFSPEIEWLQATVHVGTRCHYTASFLQKIRHSPQSWAG